MRQEVAIEGQRLKGQAASLQQQWHAAQAGKARHHDDPEYTDFCHRVDEMRRKYLTAERPHIGWAIIATLNE